MVIEAPSHRVEIKRRSRVQGHGERHGRMHMAPAASSRASLRRSQCHGGLLRQCLSRLHEQEPHPPSTNEAHPAGHPLHPGTRGAWRAACCSCANGPAVRQRDDEGPVDEHVHRILFPSHRRSSRRWCDNGVLPTCCTRHVNRTVKHTRERTTPAL